MLSLSLFLQFKMAKRIYAEGDFAPDPGENQASWMQLYPHRGRRTS
jgi:hypothetical protein